MILRFITALLQAVPFLYKVFKEHEYNRKQEAERESIQEDYRAAWESRFGKLQRSDSGSSEPSSLQDTNPRDVRD